MNYFEQKVYNYIQTHGLIEPGNRLVVGVSGGADSVCLLRVLKALMPVLHIPSQGIVVVHVHHGIRGAMRHLQRICVQSLAFCIRNIGKTFRRMQSNEI